MTQPADAVPPPPPVLLRGPDGGVYKFADPTRALATGKYHPLSTEEYEQHLVHKEEQAKGLVGSLEAGAESGFNQLLLGVPETIAEETQNPEQRRLAELKEKEHTVARGVGGAVGFGGSLLAGEGLFKAVGAAGEAAAHTAVPAAQLADASLATKLASTAVSTATQGALLAAPQATVQAAFGDPKKAAETLLWGVGTGAILGVGGEMAAAGARGLKGAAQKALSNGELASRLDSMGNEWGLRAAGMSKAQASKLSPESKAALGDFLHEQDLIQPGMTRQDIGDRIHAAHEAEGKNIGDTISSLDAILDGKKAPIDRDFIAPERREPIVTPAPTRVKRSGEELGAYLRENPEAAQRLASGEGLTEEDLFKPAAEAPAREAPKVSETKVEDEALSEALKPGEIGAKLRAELDTPEMKMPMNADQRNALQMVIDSADKLPTEVINGQEVVRFKDAQDFVSSLRRKWAGGIGRAAEGGGAKGIETVTALDQMKSAAYQIAKDTVHQSADAFAVASGQPELVGALAKSKAAYQKLSQLEKMAAELDARDAGNRKVSLTDFIAMGRGPGAMAGSAIGAGIGGLLGGGAGAVIGSHVGKVPGALLDFVGKKWAEDRGMVYLSALAKRAAKEGPDVFSAVMASEGAKRLEMTMGGVRDAVQNMAVRGIAQTKARQSEHMAALLGSTQGLSTEQQYQRLHSHLTGLATNPGALAEATSQLAAPYSGVAPEVAKAYQAKMQQAVSYLYESLPKPPAPPAPFAPNTWEPTRQQMNEFHDKAEIVNNPYRAIEHMQTGTLSPAHMEALSAIYGDAVYPAMVKAVADTHAAHPDMKLPLSERQSVAKFVRTPLDTFDSPQALRTLQASYQQQPAQGSQGQQAQGEKAPKGKIKDRPTSGTTFGKTMQTGETES